MPWSKKDLDDDLQSSRHAQTFYLLTEDPDTGDPLTTMAERLYVNVAIPELDDDGVTYRTVKLTVNANDALVAQGVSGADRQATLDSLKALAAWAKVQ